MCDASSSILTSLILPLCFNRHLSSFTLNSFVYIIVFLAPKLQNILIFLIIFVVS